MWPSLPFPDDDEDARRRGASGGGRRRTEPTPPTRWTQVRHPGGSLHDEDALHPGRGVARERAEIRVAAGLLEGDLQRALLARAEDGALLAADPEVVPDRAPVRQRKGDDRVLSHRLRHDRELELRHPDGDALRCRRPGVGPAVGRDGDDQCGCSERCERNEAPHVPLLTFDDSTRSYEDYAPPGSLHPGERADRARGTIRPLMAASTATLDRRLPRGAAHLA